MRDVPVREEEAPTRDGLETARDDVDPRWGWAVAGSGHYRQRGGGSAEVDGGGDGSAPMGLR